MTGLTKKLKLAWRGFLRFRTKRRHLTIILIIGFFFSVFFLSLFGSLLENHRAYWGGTLLGSGTIVPENTDDFRIAAPPAPDSYFRESRLKDIRGTSGLALSPRLRVPVIVKKPGRKVKTSTVLFGVDPKRELTITSDVKVIEGNYPETGTQHAALTYRGATSLNLEVGEKLRLCTEAVNGSPKCETVRVSGILGYHERTTVYRPGLPRPLIYAPLSLSQTLRGVKEGVIGEMAFREKSFLAGRALGRNLPEDFRTESLWNSSSMLSALRVVFSFFRWLIIAVILLIVFVSAYHNIKLMIQERLREIGIYMTFGANKTWVGFLWCWELTLYLLYCSVLGSGLGLGALLGLKQIGINSINRQFTLILGGSRLSLRTYPRFFLIPFFLFWLVLMLSATVPICLGLSEEIASDLLESRGRR